MTQSDDLSDDGAQKSEASNIVNLDDVREAAGLWRDVALVLARATMRPLITRTAARSRRSDSEAA
jgi:hypothetical protein